LHHLSGSDDESSLPVNSSLPAPIVFGIAHQPTACARLLDPKGYSVDQVYDIPNADRSHRPKLYLAVSADEYGFEFLRRRTATIRTDLVSTIGRGVETGEEPRPATRKSAMFRTASASCWLARNSSCNSGRSSAEPSKRTRTWHSLRNERRLGHGSLDAGDAPDDLFDE